jgi:hypothetical protein
LVPSHPSNVGRIRLFIGGVVTLGDTNGLLWLLLIAGEESLELGGVDGRQDLGISERIIGFDQPLADLDGKDGWGGGR